MISDEELKTSIRRFIQIGILLREYEKKMDDAEEDLDAVTDIAFELAKLAREKRILDRKLEAYKDGLEC